MDASAQNTAPLCAIIILPRAHKLLLIRYSLIVLPLNLSTMIQI